jgi:DNA-binding MarR family transcriptional regulator
MSCMIDSFPYIMADISQLFRRCFQSLSREFGVSSPQLRLIFMINRTPGASQGGLADALELEPMTLCRMVDRLEESGIVVRRRNPQDRRAWSLYLTEQGTELLEQLTPISDELTDIALHDLSESELTMFRQTLEKVRGNLVNHQAQLEGEVAHTKKIGKLA